MVTSPRVLLSLERRREEPFTICFPRGKRGKRGKKPALFSPRKGKKGKGLRRSRNQPPKKGSGSDDVFSVAGEGKKEKEGNVEPAASGKKKGGTKKEGEGGSPYSKGERGGGEESLLPLPEGNRSQGGKNTDETSFFNFQPFLGEKDQVRGGGGGKKPEIPSYDSKRKEKCSLLLPRKEKGKKRSG